MDNIVKLPAVIGLIFAFLSSCALVYCIVKSRNSSLGKFDERQKIIRGKAFQAGFMATLIIGLLYMVTVEFFDIQPLRSDIAVSMTVTVGMCIYLVYSIWNDAFFSFNGKDIKYLLIAFSMSLLMNIINFIIHILEGTLLEDGMLTTDFIYNISIITVLVTLGLKRILGNKEELEED